MGYAMEEHRHTVKALKQKQRNGTEAWTEVYFTGCFAVCSLM